MLQGWFPGSLSGLFKSYEAANGYQFEYPQKILGAGLILRALGMILIPVYVVYLLDMSVLPAIAFGVSITGFFNVFGFFCVVPAIEYIFNTKVSKHKKIIRYLVEYAILFIALGESHMIFTAITIVTSLVCYVGGFFVRDPTGFTKGAVNGFIDLLLVEFFCIEFCWLNIVATIVACGLCFFARLTEEKLREH
ncbi:uncharacterized protein LOC113361926 [Papaver somniferum]|uniref:uncharacterized protein LOC113361926 n=1 Tax=Papaver somniferum TaxID=3469 RepID=UPI000E6FC5DE|nr:uncharacterized protein LOC113361926 [Papaver somniferum]